VKPMAKVRKFLTPTFIKWLFVGSTSLLLDIGAFTYSYYLIEIVIVSNFIAAVISTTFNYFAHGLREVLSKILSMCILLPFNYFVLRKYVYFDSSEH
jgi:putative flippase GtrA